MKRLSKLGMIALVIALVLVPTVAAIKFGDILKYPVKILVNGAVIFIVGFIIYQFTLKKLGTTTGKEGPSWVGDVVFYIVMFLASPLVALFIGGHWIWEWMAKSPSAGFIGWLVGFQGEFTFKPIVNMMIGAFAIVLIIKLVPKLKEKLGGQGDDFIPILAALVGIIIAFLSAGVTEVAYSDTSSYYTILPDDFDRDKMVYTATADDFLWQASWFGKIKLWAWGNPDCWVAYNETIKKRTGAEEYEKEEELKKERYCYTFKDAELVGNKTTKGNLTVNTKDDPYPHPEQLSDAEIARLQKVAKNVVKGWGFLHGTRIIMFIVTLVVMLWVFHDVMKDQKFLKWFLSILIATSVVGQGTPMNTLLNVLYLVVILKVLFMKEPNPLWFGLAYMIANMGLDLLFPQYVVAGQIDFFALVGWNILGNKLINYFVTGWIIGAIFKAIKGKGLMSSIGKGALLTAGGVSSLGRRLRGQLFSMSIKDGEDIGALRKYKKDDDLLEERRRQRKEAEGKIEGLKTALETAEKKITDIKETKLDAIANKISSAQDEVTKQAADYKERFTEVTGEISKGDTRLNRLLTRLTELNGAPGSPGEIKIAQDELSAVTPPPVTTGAKSSEMQAETERYEKRLDDKRKTLKELKEEKGTLEDDIDKETARLSELGILAGTADPEKDSKLSKLKSLKEAAEKKLELAEQERAKLFSAQFVHEIPLTTSGPREFVFIDAFHKMFWTKTDDTKRKVSSNDNVLGVFKTDEKEAKDTVPFLEVQVANLKASIHNWKLHLDDILWGKMHNPDPDKCKAVSEFIKKEKGVTPKVSDSDPAYTPDAKDGGKLWIVPSPKEGVPIIEAPADCDTDAQVSTKITLPPGTTAVDYNFADYKREQEGHKSLRGLERYLRYEISVKLGKNIQRRDDELRRRGLIGGESGGGRGETS